MAKSNVKRSAKKNVAKKSQAKRSLAKKSTTKKSQTKRSLAKKSPAKKSPAKKSPAKKSPAKKSPAKKSPAKKSPAKKSPAKKSPAKKSQAKKSPAKKSPSKKSPAKKSPAKKSPAKKSPSKKSPVKKSPPKKSPAKKSPAKRKVVCKNGKCYIKGKHVTGVKNNNKNFKCPTMLMKDRKFYDENGNLVVEGKELELSEVHKYVTENTKYWQYDDFACDKGIRSDEGWMKTIENDYLRKEIIDEMTRLDPSFVNDVLTPYELEYENIIILCQLLKGIKYPGQTTSDITTINHVKLFLLGV